MRIKKMNGLVRLITLGRVRAICLAPFGIYIKEAHLENRTTRDHERIHWRQQMEMLILPFYIWYLLEWLIRIPLSGKAAYRSISFEREAYANQYDQLYLWTRGRFQWTKYLKKPE